MSDLDEFRAKLNRWTEKETAGIAEIRRRLGTSLAARPQFPEVYQNQRIKLLELLECNSINILSFKVVGDRKILRFLRGHNHDIDKVASRSLVVASYD